MQNALFHVASGAAHRRLSLLALGAMTMLGASCSGDDDSGGPTFAGEPSVTTYYAFQRETGISSIRRGNGSFESSFQVINDAEGGMALDFLGNLYQADLTEDGGAIQVLNQVKRRNFGNGVGTGTGSFNPFFDRSIAGSSTTLEEPRSVALAHGAGLVMVTDTDDNGVKVFGSSATGDVPPAFVTTMPAAPWDLAYDEPNDRLYVTLSDGTIAVVDDFVATEPAGPTGSIVPSVDGVSPAGTDLRGIVIRQSGSDLNLIVSDVGAIDGGADGQVFAFNDVTGASGLTVMDQRVRGATSGLRDPIDISLSPGGVLRVADAGRFLVFEQVSDTGTAFSGLPPFQIEPSLVIEEFRALAVLTEPLPLPRDFTPVSDVDMPAEPVLELVAATAPAGMNGAVVRLLADLSGPPTSSFDPGLPPRGVGLDVLGNVYVSFSQAGASGPEGGLRALGRLALSRGTGLDVAFDTSLDRNLEIPGNPFFTVTKPGVPTAVEIDDLLGVVVFSDLDASFTDPDRESPAIWRFGMSSGDGDIPTATGIIESTFVTGGFAIGTAEPQELDLDAQTGRLYVAVSNGTIFVYDDFVSLPGDSPDRTITPSDSLGASQISESLSGLVHDGERDLLIVSDVGPASGTVNDGAIYVFDGARFASSLTSPIAILSGAATGLDDPVSLAWDGSSLWVADSANGTISRFDDFLTLNGDVAPSATLALPDVISVELRPEGLAPTTGGSLGF